MASRFWVGGTGTWDASDTSHWAATTGGASGASVPGAADTVTLDGSSGGGTVTMGAAYNPTVVSITMGAFTGTLDLSVNNNTPTMTTFSNTGTATRTLRMGSGTWTLTGSGTTIWSCSDLSNLTLTQTGVVNANYSGSTGTRTLAHGPTGGIVARDINLSITAGSDSVDLSTTFRAAHLNFTGFAGTLVQRSMSLSGNLTLGAGMVVAGTTVSTITCAATSGTQTITSNGVQIKRAINLNGAGGTVTLADALSLGGGSSAMTLTVTNGTFNAANFNVTADIFSSSNSNTRTLTMGSGTWTLTGTGTVWDTSTITNLTLNANTSTIKINDASSSSKTFAAGALTYNNLWLTGLGTGTFIIGTSTSTTTFNDIKVDSGPHTVNVFAGKTLVATTLTLSGTYFSSLNTFQSTSAGTAWTFSVAAGTMGESYIALKDSIATGGATFNATQSIDMGNNTGWNFLVTEPYTAFFA